MTERILAVLFIFISKTIATAGYGGIMLLMAIESACIPLPSELIMPFGGYLDISGAGCGLWPCPRQGTYPSVDQTAGSAHTTVQYR